MNVIVGLGNPGPEYHWTRHNVGFMLLEELLSEVTTQATAEGQPPFKHKLDQKHQAETWMGESALLIKPLTFMNNSGQAVRSLLTFYKLLAVFKEKKLFVIHDDLDLEIGRYKIQFGTGPKVHNGLLSLYSELGNSQFWHIRVGVDGRQGDRSMPAQAYVLQRFTTEEQAILHTVFKNILHELQLKHALY